MTKFPARKRKITLWIGLCVLVLAAAAFVVARSGLDAKFVQKQLDGYIAVLKQKGAESGRDIDVTYGAVESAGGLLNRHVVVTNLVMMVKPTATAQEGDALKITTDLLEVRPRSMGLSAYEFALPHPIDFADPAEPEKSLLKVTSETPLALIVEQHKVGGADYMKLAHTLPANIDFTYLREHKAEGEEDKAPTLTPVYDTIHLTAKPDSQISSDMATDESGLGKADVSIKEVTLTPKSAPEGIITVASIEGHSSSVIQGEENLVENKLAIGPVTAGNDVLPYTPLQFTMEMAYRGPAPAAKQPTKDAVFELKTLELTGKDAALSATANFVSTPMEMMPTGKAHIKLTNAPFVRDELRKYGKLNAGNEAWIGEVVQKVTGTSLEELKELDVAINREKGGAFTIGNSTFEEIFATILKNAMKAKMPDAPAAQTAPSAVPAPQLPDANKPKSKPIAVPDTGARG